MKVNPTIFREYDIRGRVDAQGELTEENVYLIGQGFATFLKRRGIREAIIGCDARPYSLHIKDITVQSLTDSGVHVIDIGVVLVPIFYFAQYFLKKKGGVMITASHNPWGWGGFKHAYDYSTTFVPKDMHELREIVEREDFSSGRGSYETHPKIIDSYTEDILRRVSIMRPFKVLVDAGNGTAGPIVPDILRQAGCEVTEQYTDVREARHHEANPSNLGMLEAMADGVKTHSLDLGLGFDDDGDRLGAVDEKGEIVWADRVLILLSRFVLEQYPGSKIVFDVKCSEAVLEDVRAKGGIPIMWKTGHSYIKAKTKEEGAAFAGEKSGHFFFVKDYYGFDDAVFAALKLLEYLDKNRVSLSEAVSTIPFYISSPVWQVPCPDEKKYEIVEKITALFKEELGRERVLDINGARAYFDDGWGLIRASSNIPALVVAFEAKSKEGLKRIESVLREKLVGFPEVGREWTSG